jgi:DNA-binding helix-hairpin-helix protein with protein kinase domain
VYYNSKGRLVELGQQLGKGAAATVFHDRTDKSTAIKVFKPEFLVREPSLPSRLEKLYQLHQVADLDIRYGQVLKPVGSLPTDVLRDAKGRTVGYMMDTVHNGISMEPIIFARDPRTAFYKQRNSPKYGLWQSTFVYQPPSLRNRFILSYYLAHAFDRIYSIRTRTGQKLDVDICNFDIKPKNILVYIEPINGRPNIIPYILDLDNITIQNNTGRLSPAHPQFTPEYRAPEGPQDKYYDFYSIAVVFYQLIFDIHPFNVLGGTRFTDGTEMEFFVRNKCFAWGRNRRFLSPTTLNEVRHNNFQKIPASLQTLFIRAFDSDAAAQRPHMKEWITAFEAFLGDTRVDFRRLFDFP